MRSPPRERWSGNTSTLLESLKRSHKEVEARGEVGDRTEEVLEARVGEGLPEVHLAREMALLMVRQRKREDAPIGWPSLGRPA
mgnify:CR=1 FL=1